MCNFKTRNGRSRYKKRSDVLVLLFLMRVPNAKINGVILDLSWWVIYLKHVLEGEGRVSEREANLI